MILMISHINYVIISFHTPDENFSFCKFTFWGREWIMFLKTDRTPAVRQILTLD